ncbi:MAG TPA: DNA translocase FtsK 4TM domain-containing protein [Longimicrobiales bacterium]|nr:DNA translocase FtsK 4TM domain-containing protein [Longimicrobiales bacterium]
MISSRQRRQLFGIGFLALAVFSALSLVPVRALGGVGLSLFPTGNVMGVLGGLFAGAAVTGLGFAAILVPALLAVVGAAFFDWLEAGPAARWGALLLGLLVLLPALTALFSRGSGVELLPLLPRGPPGWTGRTVVLPFAALLGGFGALLALIVLLLALFVGTIGWNPVGAAARHVLAAIAERRAVRIQAEEPEAEPADVAAFVPVPAPAVAADDGATTPPAAASLVPRLLRRKKEAALPAAFEDTGDPGSTDQPPLSLLSEPPAGDPALSDAHFDRLGDVLIRTLRTFKVEGQIAGRTTGPVVTQFEVVPAPGVKVNRIAALDADLALALRAPSIRIVAPIPGKGAVGVEVPNPEPEVVYLRRILETPTFQRARGALPLALGKDLNGRPYVADLAKMPHLLIAGATGSGKSICINTLITSLVYRHPPRSLRLLMIDPKMVELSMYADLPHLRHPVVTDPHDAATVLKWAVFEMARRYSLLSVNGARSLAEFNRRAEDGQSLRRAEAIGPEDDPERWTYREGPLPYIVLVVDELADLMMSVQAEIEKPLAQLAQKARAIGIHLIVATQRPSVNVITGLIKANFPCRIAFRVSSKVDSRTIIDQNGADALLGNGDMLFLPPGTSDPVRIQGAFISTEDTEQIMDWYRAASAEAPSREDDILEVVRAREAAESADDADHAFFDERDALFRQAAEVCVQFQQGSTSLLQRRLRIGYGRAARIIDQLHNAGVLGPPDGSKPREVLIGMESVDHICSEP